MFRKAWDDGISQELMDDRYALSFRSLSLWTRVFGGKFLCVCACKQALWNAVLRLNSNG